MTDFTKDDSPTGEAGTDGGDLVRQQTWPCAGPAELELAVDLGRIRVELVDGGDEVRAEVRHDPTAGGPFAQGVSGIMSWLGTSGLGAGMDPDQLARDAVRAAEISWDEGGKRLVVHSPQELPLRTVPLAVTVTAPAGSRLAARTGSGDVTTTGTAGRAAVRTGSGEVRTGPVEGDADVTTGSGDVDLGAVAGRGQVRTGSGGVRVAAVGGPAEVRASSGDVHVREVGADLSVRTGSGDVTVSDVRAGQLDLTTGSGALWIGVHAGVAAELDLSSGSGKARSDLVVNEVPSATPLPVRVKGRTGSGDVLVTRAAPPRA